MKNEFKNIAKNLMFQLSEAEIDLFLEDFQEIESYLKPLKEIDTKDVLPLRYPFENVYSDLVTDEVKEQHLVSDLLSNTKNKEKDLVVVKRVVI